MVFVIAGVLGILLGLLIPYNLSLATLPYVAVAIIAALDSVFGALLANFNKKFNLNVFMIGLISNAILAVLLTYMGNILGINLSFAVIIVFGVRIFNNMASIRRITFDIYFERRAREKERLTRLALEAGKKEDDEENSTEPSGDNIKSEDNTEKVEEHVEKEKDKEETK